ncbi:PREDICTED: uncharacterized protein LOC109584546 [Amphimedon queenslandica]|uniref:Uncharacterized protein n=1 Tax=Amphimedon queenslandica TaxID=400682 RepID=A0AAN0JFR3_AMPQE|nr:PREDICTED: uncharacterized protein LOC109584546 [Amphimedon queenslandica]|eukprot:XP_019855880.1 PREDICTED: uncharacterized protein LOC109584546 [Amphimedon queenslandica]
MWEDLREFCCKFCSNFSVKTMKIIILYTLGLISLALSCNILDLELVSLKTMMGLKATSRTVPVNTLVTFNCSTSNCVHVAMYMSTIQKNETKSLKCDAIDMDGTLICHNITITEPVKVRCVGTQSSGNYSCEPCHSWGSILIGIEESTTVPCINKSLPCNCSSSTKPTSQENEAPKCTGISI